MRRAWCLTPLILLARFSVTGRVVVARVLVRRGHVRTNVSTYIRFCNYDTSYKDAYGVELES